ncbi:hypothetical protein CcrC1_gp069c [Caulobacter phage C1]|nr:hypothetical protein CcrC1_gp069c [Caulobacter phage C1]UTU08296.1 hypothetical protein CcrC2_gp068c [Caulobacter phage C2]UTU08819.1 hypothetical protein CcrJ4_gp068c [Caulobacter phage J4]UTU09371.1 hypothetical protein CcrBL47_gp085c [Caulobacter phage BL47]UTU09931.1 hypothetical protein CcrRB23_gp069c [Caulobacter phage RB23]WGN96956.1 hypothetical protein [Bertelyvirus sp.]
MTRVEFWHEGTRVASFHTQQEAALTIEEGSTFKQAGAFWVVGQVVRDIETVEQHGAPAGIVVSDIRADVTPMGKQG